MSSAFEKARIMRPLFGNPNEGYETLTGWKYWMPAAETMRSEGWKLHVAGNPQVAQAMLNCITPVLQRLEVSHKFLPSVGDFAVQTEEQTGKWFCVYPNTVMMAFVCVEQIDEAIIGAGLKDATVTAVPDERPVGSTFVFTRYGGYEERKVRNPVTGKLIRDQVGKSLKPEFIADPWDSYNPLAKMRLKVVPRSWHDPFPRYTAKGGLK
jgi:hypothetical protein